MTTVPSADAKAVVRAVEQLSTQLRRAVDAYLTPVVVDEVAEADAPTTPATTCSAQNHAFVAIRQCIRAAQHHGDHIDDDGFHWSDTVAVYPVDPGLVKVAGTVPWHEALADRVAPAGDEDAQRAARQGTIGHLLERVDRGRLTFDEGALLRRLIVDEAHEADLARRETVAADRIRAEAQRDRDQHAAVLAEVLRSFRHETHPGRRCLQSEHVPVEEVQRWRSVVAPTAERPWWVDVAEIRAELTEAQAAIDRVRHLVTGAAQTTAAGLSDHDIGRYDMAVAVLAALDGTEQPTPED